jgi:uncharacterized phiE125 gp8 family phage protein
MLKPKLITAPANAILTRDEAKAQLAVGFTDDDNIIDGLIKSATAYLDGWGGVLRRCMITQTWQQDFTDWADWLRLPFPDVSGIGSVKYVDTEGVEQTVASGDYALGEDAAGGFVFFKDTFTAPSLSDNEPAPIRVQYDAGYGANAGDVPESLRHAALLLISHWYENRSAVGQPMEQLPLGVDALIAPHRRVRI